jgi:hypothetical protein
MTRSSSLLLAILLTALCGSALAASDAKDKAIERSLDAVAATFSNDVQSALREIDGTPRRLLAMRGYLRARDTLAARWSWSGAQIEAYGRSPQYAQMLAEIAKINERFQQANPGYSLYANTQVRSLGVQLERWNKNRTVGKVADRLYVELRSSTESGTAEALSRFLVEWRPPTPIPLAAPGMSLHGQSKALDFQVRAGDKPEGRIVAGPDTSSVKSVWEDQGWARKLAAAVSGASDRFKGPLRSPNEPWHFEYASELPDARPAEAHRSP